MTETERKRTTVTLTRVSQQRYEVRNSRGTVIEIATEGDQFRPGELFLAAIAACSSVDVDVMTSRRAEPDVFEVKSSAHKSTEGGNHFEDIEVSFKLRFPAGEQGQAARDRIAAAVKASHERECTVSRTIEAGTPVKFVVDDQDWVDA